MHASSTVDEVDVKGAAFCGGCASVLEGKGWE
jgi:predicted Zn-dependent protease